MRFTEKFLESIDSDPVTAILAVCSYAMQIVSDCGAEFNSESLDSLLECYALVSGIAEAHRLSEATVLNPLNGDVQNDSAQLANYLMATQGFFRAKSSKLKIEQYKNKYKTALNMVFAFEFSQGDLEKIQDLITELRAQISRCDLLEEGHKRRLLLRLEKLQSELHKRISDLDRFWGLVGDAGVVLAKLGNDAKPIVDRIREIADIVWRTQSRTEELPSDLPRPLLGNETNSA